MRKRRFVYLLNVALVTIFASCAQARTEIEPKEQPPVEKTHSYRLQACGIDLAHKPAFSLSIIGWLQDFRQGAIQDFLAENTSNFPLWFPEEGLTRICYQSDQGSFEVSDTVIRDYIEEAILNPGNAWVIPVFPQVESHQNVDLVVFVFAYRYVDGAPAGEILKNQVTVILRPYETEESNKVKIASP